MNPIDHRKGREQLFELYQLDHPRLKKIIGKVYTKPIAKFFSTAKNIEKGGFAYNFNTHKFQVKTGAANGEQQNIYRASRDFLLYRIEKLAEKFTQGTAKSEEKVKDYLLHKLGIENLSSTAEFINRKDVLFGSNHPKLAALLVKVYDGAFLSKKEKAQKKGRSASRSNQEELSRLTQLRLGKEPAAEVSVQPVKKNSFFLRLYYYIKQIIRALAGYLRKWL